MAGMTYDPRRMNMAVQKLRKSFLRQSEAWASERQVAMKQSAPWTDRGGKDSVTGLTARESLEGEAGLLPNGDIQIILRSTRQSKRPWRGGAQAPVGAFLELKTRRMRQKYDVIWRTLEEGIPDLRERVQLALEASYYE